MRSRLIQRGCRIALYAVNLSLIVRHPVLFWTYWEANGYLPNVALPTGINEKTTWRKIFDRNPMWPLLQDKITAKEYVKKACPDLETLPILWAGTDPLQIPFNNFTEPVIIKANHGCGYNSFVDDPPRADKIGLGVRFITLLQSRFGRELGEWAYSQIRPRIFVEAQLRDDRGRIASDVKVDVAGGIVRSIEVVEDKYGEETAHFLDRGFRPIEPVLGQERPPPEFSAQMQQHIIENAERLGAGLDYIRVDFLRSGDRIVFCEFAVYPGSGLWRVTRKTFAALRSQNWDVLKSHYFAGGVQTTWKRIYRGLLQHAA